MKILIIAYHFYPAITPRAFRAFELTKQLAKEGHEVKILLPGSDYDYAEICKKYNFSVDFVDYKKTSGTTSSVVKISHSWSRELLKKSVKKIMLCFFPGGKATMFYFYYVYKKLMDHHEEQDMIISIATPIDTHIGTAMAIKRNRYLRDTTVKVADYGDPLYKDPTLPNCPFYFWMEKFIASQFDFITTPTEKALPVFRNFKKKEEIKVIPQGFDFSETKLADYQENDIPTFAYAGMFYEDIRNPKVLLDFLLKLHADGVDFKFIIYTKTENPNNTRILEKYKNILGSKLIVKQAIPRLDVIFELSKMDFLINIDNLAAHNIPSKLIDYALTKRPILSFNQLSFSENVFMEFLNRDYRHSLHIDLDRYNIKTVTKQFLDLYYTTTQRSGNKTEGK